jgi:hypothetical protein
MKVLPRIGSQVLPLVLLLGMLGGVSSRAQSPSASPGPKRGSAAILLAVKVTADAKGPGLEILSSGPLNPTLESLDRPLRLVIDLPDTRVSCPRKPLRVDSDQISRVRVNQFQQTPPVARVVLDLIQPVGYSIEGSGGRWWVRLHSMSEARQASPEPDSVTALTAEVQPAVVPRSAGNSAAGREAESRLAGDSSVTAGSDATILHLPRGGEVRVCPGTTLSLTTSQDGRDLMLGMSTGAIEAHYSLSSAADSVLTPDFRMLLAGAGEVHYAFSADARGNTCIRALPGNTASVNVSELLGEGTYQVQAKQQIVFRAGRLNRMDTSVPADCGCPPPAIPVLRAAAEPTALSRTAPLQTADLGGMPAPERGAAQVQVDVPLVFQARDPVTPASPDAEAESLPLSHVANPPPLLTTAQSVFPAEVKRQSPGLLGRLKGFFAAIFR